MNIMKKHMHLMLFILIFSSLVGCMNNTLMEKKVLEEQKKDVKQIVWEQLSKEEKDEIIGGWEDATIEKVIADKKRFSLKDDDFHGKEVYIVIFRSNRVELLGNIKKLVDIENNKIIGNVPRM